MIMERIVLYVGLSPVIIGGGIFGNVLTLIVLRRTQESSSTSQLLKGLAVADLMTLIIRCICIAYIWAQLFTPERYQSWTLNSFTFFQLSLVPERISKCLIVAIVFERTVAVTAPLRFKSICTSFSSNVAIITIYIINVFAAIPKNVDVIMHLLNTEAAWPENPMMQKEIEEFKQYRPLKFKVMTIYNYIYRGVLDFLPMPLVMVGNIIIIIGLRKSRKQARSISSQLEEHRKHQERQLTKLLMTVTFIFVILCGPFHLFVALVYFGLLQLDFSTSALILDIFRTLTLLNSAINFIVYAIKIKKYREGYKRILTCAQIR